LAAQGKVEAEAHLCGGLVIPSAGDIVAKIDINTAEAKQLTQLPGVAKNLAYNIVNHRKRHGWFTNWEELKEVKGFPADKLKEVKAAAVLTVPDGEGAGPRHLRSHLKEIKKKPSGYSKAIRATRMSDRLKQG
jgi:competence ComEA-like helix-hairpin-helix protein